MKILINDKNIDFTLEQEEKFGDVIKDLEKWITQNDNVIRHVRVNNKILDLEDFNVENRMKIEDIKKVEIVTSNKIELAFDTLETINQYRATIISMFDDDINEIINRNDEILEGISLILEGFQLSLKILNINPIVVINNKGKKLDVILLDLDRIINEYEKRYLDESAIDLIGVIMSDIEEYLLKVHKWGIVKNFKKIKNETIDEIPFIGEILKDLLIVCKEADKKFEEIGTDIQIGEDLKAFKGIYYLSDIINEIIEVFRVIKGIVIKNNRDILEDLEAEKIFENITEYLKEVEKSFHINDLVTIADIIEYELKPLFEKLIGLIDKIADLID